jgi:hypothetical protein
MEKEGSWQLTRRILISHSEGCCLETPFFLMLGDGQQEGEGWCSLQRLLEFLVSAAVTAGEHRG